MGGGDAQSVELSPMDGVEAVALARKHSSESGGGKGSGSPCTQVPSNREAGAPWCARVEVKWIAECCSRSCMRAR